MEIPRRDVKISSPCHVATWNSHVATSLLHVATSFGHLLCHVATWPRTSRRHLDMFSVTSRREPERRDVGLFALCHVATSPCMSRRDPVFSPRNAHFGHSPHAPSLTRTLAPLRPTLHRTCWRPHPTGRRPLPCSPTTVSHPLWPILGHSGISTTVCPILAWVQ